MTAPSTEAELDLWIKNKIDESVQLDFKAAEALHNSEKNKTEISKDVSALANAIGGMIVYGIKENPADHTADAISPIDRRVVTNEWLEQVINSRIQPRISGVRITPVPLLSHGADSVAYVVEIPESVTAHQASDKKYYKRFNFQSVAMEDYEVRQTMNRPRLAAYRAWLEVKKAHGADRLVFAARVLNVGEIVGHDCSSYFYVPPRFFLTPEEWQLVEIEGEAFFRLESHGGASIDTFFPGHPEQFSYFPEVNVDPGDPNLRGTTMIYFRVYDSAGLALAMRGKLLLGTPQITNLFANPKVDFERRSALARP